MNFQVQLSVLKEEKRKMMLQLRLEEAERNKRNISNDSSAVDGPVSGKRKTAEKKLMVEHRTMKLSLTEFY
jgi:hypothetical protein